MRCVIVSDFGAVNGGAAKVAIESARGLAEAGVEVVFACAIGPVSERLDHPGISVELFGAEDVWRVGSKLTAARQGIWNERAYAFLLTLFRKQPPRTPIHLHQWTKAFSPAAIAAAGESGLPVAITLHDYFAFCPTGGYFDFRAKAPCRLSPMSASCIASNCDRASYPHKLVRVARQWRSDRALRALRQPLFIHVSELARGVAEPFLPPSARHVVIENMMDVPQRGRVDVAGNRHVLFLGRLTREKGVLELARAARQAGMPLRLAGDGDEAMTSALREVCPEAEITGWLDAQQVTEAIRTARCLAAPSLWYETGPLSVPEAMAQGVPPVLSRRAGAAGRVRDGIDGMLFDPADDGALAGALLALADPAYAARLGKAAYDAYWSRPPSLERHVERLLASYAAGPAADA